MPQKSTWVILAGVVLLFVPIPPFATIAGALVIAAGVALRLRDQGSGGDDGIDVLGSSDDTDHNEG